MTTGSSAILGSEDLFKLHIRPAKISEIPSIFGIAQRLISKDVAGPGLLHRIFRKNRSTLLVVDEAIEPDQTAGHASAKDTLQNSVTGFIATLPMTASGVRALWNGTFSGLQVDPQWVASEREAPEAVYIWALAGETRKAKASIWKSARILEREIYPDVPYYATAGTKIGSQLLNSLGYERLADTTQCAPPNLYGRSSHIEQSAAA